MAWLLLKCYCLLACWRLLAQTWLLRWCPAYTYCHWLTCWSDWACSDAKECYPWPNNLTSKSGLCSQIAKYFSDTQLAQSLLSLINYAYMHAKRAWIMKDMIINSSNFNWVLIKDKEILTSLVSGSQCWLELKILSYERNYIVLKCAISVLYCL